MNSAETCLLRKRVNGNVSTETCQRTRVNRNVSIAAFLYLRNLNFGSGFNYLSEIVLFVFHLLSVGIQTERGLLHIGTTLIIILIY